MSDDRELLEEFVQESRELLEGVEGDLLAFDAIADDERDEVVHRLFRAVHSVKGAAGFFGLRNIGELSHQLENVLGRVRDKQLTPQPSLVDTLLRANDRLRTLLEDVDGSDEFAIDDEMLALAPWLATGDALEAIAAAAVAPAPPLPRLLERPSEVPGLSEERRQALIGHGQHLYVVTLELPGDLNATGDGALPVFLERVASLGEVLAVDGVAIERVDPSAARAGRCELAFASILAPDLAPLALRLPGERVRELRLRREEPTAQEDAGEDAPDAHDAHDARPPHESGPAPAPAAGVRREPRAAGREAETTGRKADETVRVKTSVLDTLMQMAGEMVLARNRLLRRVEIDYGAEGLQGVIHELRAVTSALQEEIMSMRLQPIGTLFGRFHRVVRDLGHQLGKDVALRTRGDDVDVDRTILEALTDPLTHLLRNALDHGLEAPDVRAAAGKGRGEVLLEAFHHDGMVQIDVSDNGRGIDVEAIRRSALKKGLIAPEDVGRMSADETLALIFRPGFSTSAKATEVSGRGVGMDVVRTNIEKVGGTVAVSSKLGEGTKVSLKLPLTLAIVPSLIIETGGQRFALPQVGLEEVVRLDASEHHSVERIHDCDVLRHRGRLLPLVRLSTALALGGGAAEGGPVVRQSERVLVLRVGSNRYGLVVERVLDTEEIVVKPLSRYVRSIRDFSGVTILGDGGVALILDPVGIAHKAQLRFADIAAASEAEHEATRLRASSRAESVLLFACGRDSRLAIPLEQVSRIEQAERGRIEYVGQEAFLEYLGRSLPLLWPAHALGLGYDEDGEGPIQVLIPKLARHPVGLVTSRVLEARDIVLDVDRENARREGLVGSTLVDGHIVLLLEAHGFLAHALPSFFTPPDLGQGTLRALQVDPPSMAGWVAQDDLEALGMAVERVASGEEAWSALTADRYDLVVTDLDVGRLDGGELARRMRATPELAGVPVVAFRNGGTTGRDERFDETVARFDRDGLRRVIEARVLQVPARERRRVA